MFSGGTCGVCSCYVVAVLTDRVGLRLVAHDYDFQHCSTPLRLLLGTCYYHGWSYVQLTIAQIRDHFSCVDPYVLIPLSRHVDAQLATSTHSSPRRRTARHLDAGLTPSTCSSPPQCGAPHIDLRLSSSSSPPRCAARHLDTQLATSTRSSPPRHASHHDAGLVMSKPGSPPRRAAWDLNAGLSTSTCGSPSTSTRGSQRRLTPCHVVTRLAT
ncbi:hypothetical protein K438DRAFT_2020634 [Mycena galopus ATCC 62051]|nr:hypothetical protein K438DRAFT_2020634 [Mycena galopus ATCC 62051]